MAITLFAGGGEMVRVVILGQGYVGSIFAIGLERIKKGEVNYYGIPLANELPNKGGRH